MSISSITYGKTWGVKVLQAFHDKYPLACNIVTSFYGLTNDSLVFMLIHKSTQSSWEKFKSLVKATQDMRHDRATLIRLWSAYGHFERKDPVSPLHAGDVALLVNLIDKFSQICASEQLPAFRSWILQVYQV